LNEELPSITEFEDHLRNGVYLAKLARFFAPEMVKKVFDEKQASISISLCSLFFPPSRADASFSL